MPTPKVRASEWVLLAFFGYLALLVPLFPSRPHLRYQPVLIFAIVVLLVLMLALGEQITSPGKTFSMIRDWVPLGLVLAAFREMELFVPRVYDTGLEQAWIRWDDILLDRWVFTRWVAAAGPIVPWFLEICYLLVYGLGAYCIAVLWLKNARRGVDRFYTIYLTGTLLAYSLFPYFPSRPPRIAFPAVGEPVVTSVFRTWNLLLLKHATIHVGVFPSAHVSSAFSAAWAMFFVLPKQHKSIAWGMLIYALCVSAATVYGRYHYAVDVLAGFAVSLIAASLCRVYWARDARGTFDGAPANAPLA